MTIQGAEPVVNTFKYDNTRTIKLTFEDDITIECSPLHLFLTNPDDITNPESWISADELLEGDEVFVKTADKLKLLKKEQGELNTVYDIEVANAHHYLSKDGIVMHNSIGSYIPGQTISGGGGAIYNASIILQFSKAQLKEDGAGGNKTGIIVTSKVAKNRFARPIPIKFHISFFKGMNPFVGLEEFINWESCGIQKGRLLTQKEFDKKPADQKAAIENTRFVHTNENGAEEVFYFEAKDTARTIAVRHLCDHIKPNELFTSRVITDDILRLLDETVIKKTFMLPNINDLNELEDVELSDEILNNNED